MSNRILTALVAASALSFTSTVMAAGQGAYSGVDAVPFSASKSITFPMSVVRNARAQASRSGVDAGSVQPEDSDIANNTLGPYYCGNDNFGGSEEACALLRRR